MSTQSGIHRIETDGRRVVGPTVPVTSQCSILQYLYSMLLLAMIHQSTLILFGSIKEGKI